MSRRLIVLLATVALLLVGAVPVSAAPGGVPGPPPGHSKSADDVDGDVAVPEGESERNGPPEWANAYGKRIKDEHGIPFGHVQQCARAYADLEAAEGDEVATDGDVKKALEACPDLEMYPFPEDQSGAKAYWLSIHPKVGVETFAT